MERLAKFFTSIGGVLTALAALVGGIAALFLAFNGGGGESSEANAPTLQAWDTQANEICRTLLQRSRQFGQPRTSQELIAVMEQVLPTFKASTNELRALEKPPAAAGRIDQLIRNWDDQADAAEAVVIAAQNNDVAGLQSAARDVGNLSDSGNRMAAGLGAPKCAEDLFASP